MCYVEVEIIILMDTLESIIVDQKHSRALDDRYAYLGCDEEEGLKEFCCRFEAFYALQILGG